MERPILFSTPMVQAIMEGRKTQTRRIVKSQSKSSCFDIAMMTDGSNKWPRNLDADERFISYMKCPYGSIGDILWVRETWQHTKCLNVNPEDESFGYIYKADCEPWEDIEGWAWKPSIFMPREACRIRLKVSDVWVERLQDISEEDAIAEGVELNQFGSYKDYSGEIDFIHARNSYMTLWESINGKDSWDKNRWVWVITFERIE